MVIFKDRFAFAAADLEKYIDGAGTPQNPPAFALSGLIPLIADQMAEYEQYEEKQSLHKEFEFVRIRDMTDE